MGLFRGQTGYFRATDQDQAWGSTVDQISGTAGVDTDWTMTFTSEDETTATLIPFTNTSHGTNDDTRTNNGWAFNEDADSNDGIGATSTMSRIVHAGTWSFYLDITMGAPATGGNYDVTAVFSVYRVASDTSRSLEFTATSNTANSGLLGSSATLAASASRPDFILEAGETLHVAVRITSYATSLLGAVTDSVITFEGATSGVNYISISTPGMRNRYLEEIDIDGSAVVTRIANLSLINRDFSAKGTTSVDKSVSMTREIDIVAVVEVTREPIVITKVDIDTVCTASISADVCMDADLLPDGGGLVIEAGQFYLDWD